MAEFAAAAGLASSIITFVDFSARVLKRLNQYNSAVHDSPDVFRSIAMQLPVVASVLRRTKDACHDGSLPRDAPKILGGAMADCQAVVKKLDELIDKIAPAAHDSALQRFGKSVVAAYREADANELHERLCRSVGVFNLYYA
jgi:hypothetical protein